MGVGARESARTARGDMGGVAVTENGTAACGAPPATAWEGVPPRAPPPCGTAPRRPFNQPTPVPSPPPPQCSAPLRAHPHMRKRHPTRAPHPKNHTLACTVPSPASPPCTTQFPPTAPPPPPLFAPFRPALPTPPLFHPAAAHTPRRNISPAEPARPVAATQFHQPCPHCPPHFFMPQGQGENKPLGTGGTYIPTPGTSCAVVLV